VNLFEHVLIERRDELDTRGMRLIPPYSTLLMTPRFPLSRHVIAFVHDAVGLQLVMKVPRRPGDVSGIQNEAACLEALDGVNRDHRPGPRLVGLVEVGRSTVLVETPCQGTLLPRRLSARRAADVLRAAIYLTDGMPQTGARPAAWFEDEVEKPLLKIQALAGADPAIAHLVERTRKVLHPLRDADLPSVLEHGDMNPPNLFIHGRRMQAVDWERGSVVGLPGQDLVTLLMYIARSRSRTARVDLTYDTALVRPGAWGRVLLEAHLRTRGVATELAPLLAATAWLRGVTSRLAAATGGPPVDSPLDPRAGRALWQTLKADRDYPLWPIAVNRLSPSRG